MNSTVSALSYFILDAYLNIGNVRYLYFMITALLYIVVLFTNTTLVVLICVNRSLHEPMYLLLLSLFVNELYGSAGFFPFLLLQILSDVHAVSAPACFLQIFCLYSYANVEFCNLAVMSYDRYVAVCCPLQYSRRMSGGAVLLLVLLLWLYGALKCLITLSLSLHLQLCGNVLDSLYCHNYLIVKLACSDTTVNNVYGLLTLLLSVLLPMLTILFSYMKILQVCFSGSNQTRHKAVSTCSPQLASLLNFSCSCFFEIIRTRFDMKNVPHLLQIIFSTYLSLVQPFLNPLMYGLQMSKLRNAWKDLLCNKRPDGPKKIIQNAADPV